jgi:hypothetical protein
VHSRLPEPADGVVEDAVRIEPLTKNDIVSAVQLAVRVLRTRPGDRGEQFASDITDDHRQMFVAKANGQVVAYGRVTELAADEAGPRNRPDPSPDTCPQPSCSASSSRTASR